MWQVYKCLALAICVPAQTDPLKDDNNTTDLLLTAAKVGVSSCTAGFKDSIGGACGDTQSDGCAECWCSQANAFITLLFLEFLVGNFRGI